MMRSNRPTAAVTARKSHARALHARAGFLARARSVRTCGLLVATAANGRIDRVVERLENATQRRGRID
eukprot:9181478-Lingulodinium_polyedra.AAC.1